MSKSDLDREHTDEVSRTATADAPAALGIRAAALSGTVYLVMGATLFWYCLFTLFPFMEARTEFESYHAQNKNAPVWVDQIQTMMKDMNGPDIAGEAKAVLNLYLGIFKIFFKELQLPDAEGKYPLTRINDKAIELAKADDPEFLSLDEAGSVAINPKWVFQVWMIGRHSHLQDDLGSEWLSDQPPRLLALLTFSTLALAVGLFFGGFRMLVSQLRPGESRVPMKSYVLPWLTPIGALLVILLLNGFGPLFVDTPDTAESRFLIIVTAAIAAGPEEFLRATRGYLVQVAAGLTESSAEPT